LSSKVSFAEKLAEKPHGDFQVGSASADDATETMAIAKASSG
jgi:hypothetical protein